MYHVNTQGIDERMINVHYYYYHMSTTSSLFSTCYGQIIFENDVLKVT